MISAHRDEGAENLGADGISGQRHAAPPRAPKNASGVIVDKAGLWRLKDGIWQARESADAARYFDVHHQLHLGMDVAADLEGSGLRKVSVNFRPGPSRRN